MINLIGTFIFLTLVIAGLINFWGSLERDEKVQILKLLGKAAIYAVISMGILSTITFLF